MATRVRDHIRIHKIVTTRRGLHALPFVLIALYGLGQFTTPIVTGGQEMALGTYNPFTDEITIYEERIEDASLSLEHVQVHERFHRWQYQNIPYLLDATIVATGAMFVFLLFAVVTLDGVWFKFAALSLLMGSSAVEIPAYMVTMVRTGEPAFAWLFYAVLPLMLIQIGRYTDLFAGYVTRNPARIPLSMQQNLGSSRWYRQDVAREKRRRRWHE